MKVNRVKCENCIHFTVCRIKFLIDNIEKQHTPHDPANKETDMVVLSIQCEANKE